MVLEEGGHDKTTFPSFPCSGRGHVLTVRPMGVSIRTLVNFEVSGPETGGPQLPRPALETLGYKMPQVELEWGH